VYHALVFLAAPAENSAMKKSNTSPQQIWPGHFVYVVPRPDSREPRVSTLGAFGWLLRLFGVKAAYTVRPTKFNRFGQITHESRLLEVETKHSTLMYSFFE